MDSTRTIVTATLVKHHCDDGLCEVWDDVPLGKSYRVILETRELVMMWNISRQIYHWKEIIYDADEGGWLLVECLKIQTQ